MFFSLRWEAEGQILALAFSSETLNHVTMLPLGSEADLLEVLLLGCVKVDDIVEPQLLRVRLYITFFSENLLLPRI